MSEAGKLIVVSGPSGAGKSTVIAKVMQKRADVCFSVSATTRAPRDGETHGTEYFFITREDFEGMIEAEQLLEHAEYVGNCYGTPAEPVTRQLAQGCNVILDIEVQGAAQVRRRMPEATFVFLCPPNIDALATRLCARNKDSEEKILRRLEVARQEYTQASEYDYIVINDDADIAAKELSSIITAIHCKAEDRIKLILKD